MVIVLAGLLIKSTGALPSYLMAALLAESLNHIERKNGFRADGFAASVNSIAQTVVMGLSQTILLAGINGFSYLSPTSVDQIITQNDAVRSFFSMCYIGMPMIGHILCVVIMLFYKIDTNTQTKK